MIKLHFDPYLIPLHVMLICDLASYKSPHPWLQIIPIGNDFTRIKIPSSLQRFFYSKSANLMSEIGSYELIKKLKSFKATDNKSLHWGNKNMKIQCFEHKKQLSHSRVTLIDTAFQFGASKWRANWITSISLAPKIKSILSPVGIKKRRRPPIRSQIFTLERSQELPPFRADVATNTEPPSYSRGVQTSPQRCR